MIGSASRPPGSSGGPRFLNVAVSLGRRLVVGWGLICRKGSYSAGFSHLHAKPILHRIDPQDACPLVAIHQPLRDRIPDVALDRVPHGAGTKPGMEPFLH